MLPTPLLWTFTLALALALGSFLNVCISRLPQHRSVAVPPSHCPQCKTPIAARDNLPLLSWLLLRGRCRSCRLPIAIRYPLVEAGYAALVAACVLHFGDTAAAAAASVLCFLLLGLFVTDLETQLLPDLFTLPGVVLGLAAIPASSGSPVDPSFLAGVFCSRVSSAALWTLLLLAMGWSYGRVRRVQGLGMGDVKFVAMLAAWFGNQRMALIFLMAVVGASILGLGTALFQSGGRRGLAGAQNWRSIRLPLGSFLAAGAVYALFWGDRTVAWYLGLFR